jgi:hypothetical protein
MKNILNVIVTEDRIIVTMTKWFADDTNFLAEVLFDKNNIKTKDIATITIKNILTEYKKLDNIELTERTEIFLNLCKTFE